MIRATMIRATMIRATMIRATMIRAEWTKLRTVRGWVAGLIAAALAVVGLGVLVAAGSRTSCMNGPVEVACPAPPTGPDGRIVDDRFAFVHRPLTGDGQIVAQVTDLTGIITYPPPGHDQIVPGVVPWAKAGIMVKDGIKPGSAYAAMLLTGHHGVRMQSDYTRDQAADGFPGPSWLRLVRRADKITGSASADGVTWHEIGTTTLAGLPATVQVGLFVASPSDITAKPNTRGGAIVQARFTQATGTFEHISAGGGWTYDPIGHSGDGPDWTKTHPPGFHPNRAGDAMTVTGSGDIAPGGASSGMTVERTLIGLVVGLLLVIVVAVLFVTGEYRRGLIRTTLAAEPRRGRVLAAKAVVLGTVVFATGLVAAAVTVPLSIRLLVAGGNHVASVPLPTTLRVVVGAAALLSAAALLAYALGALIRRGVLAVAAAVALIVLPYLLATASVLPVTAGQWLLRVTPAAGFAIMQSIPAYPQVLYPYAPADGYFPLAPWAGLAVLLGWVAVALALAARRIRRGDA